MIKSKTLTYNGEKITVKYDVARCLHVGNCVKGAPEVFDPDRKPWVEPDQATADKVAQVIETCPTGALTYERTDGGSEESTPAANAIEVEKDGPLDVTGDLRLETLEGEKIQGARDVETRMALCRCGLSSNKPLCDNSHVDKFEAEATLGDPAGDPIEESPSGVLHLRPAPNGPYVIEGRYEVKANGDSFRGKKGALCRCGMSGNKPWCDGSHATGGFQAE